ncbi:MAG: hypothetical protein GY742_19115 [Hyphomicrobiales bacterium]|nr:hypothetical protein [Hyphomicrobiales bacterium]
MSIVKKQSDEEFSADHTIGDVLGKLISELAIIADDIEELPFTGMGSLTREEMIAYQKVDFSSQKLRDFSNLLTHLSKNNGLRDLAVPNGVWDELTLEYTSAMLAVRNG